MPGTVSATAKAARPKIAFETISGTPALQLRHKAKAKAKPATMDLTPDEGPEKGKTMKAIYKLEKGVLTIAVIEGKEGETKRPANFDGKGDDEILLELTKEEKKKDEK